MLHNNINQYFLPLNRVFSSIKSTFVICRAYRICGGPGTSASLPHVYSDVLSTLTHESGSLQSRHISWHSSDVQLLPQLFIHSTATLGPKMVQMNIQLIQTDKISYFAYFICSQWLFRNKNSCHTEKIIFIIFVLSLLYDTTKSGISFFFNFSLPPIIIFISLLVINKTVIIQFMQYLQQMLLEFR